VRRFGGPENRLFAGAVTTGFALLGVVAMARQWRGRNAPGSLKVAAGASLEPRTGEPAPDRLTGEQARRAWDRGVLGIGVFFGLLTFAWFYLPLSKLLPGLAQMRVPTRGYPFVSFALAILAATGVDRLLTRFSTRSARALAGVAIGVVLLFELRPNLPWKAWPPPHVDLTIFHEIARRPEVKAVLHLPLFSDFRGAHYMYYSTLHWKPIANGYSGYAPPTWDELWRRFEQSPLDDGTIDYLLDLGVTHVATHPTMFKRPRQIERMVSWERHFSRGPAPRIRVVAGAGEDRLYELVSRADAAFRD
jgi:hypothetical protein